MGQLVVSMYVSFDGVVEGPGGAEDFEHAAGAGGSSTMTRPPTPASSSSRHTPCSSAG